MGLLTQTTKGYYDDSANYGSYQFITLSDIVNNFMIAYVGENKIISKIKKTDVLFHTKRGIQELSFDTLPSTKAIEATLGAALSFTLPQDYVNYVNISFVDDNGVKRIIYPTRATGNAISLKGTADDPTDANSDTAGTDVGVFDPNDLNAEAAILSRFKAAPTSNDNESTDLTDADLFDLFRYGNRYGSTPEHTQANGVFYIDEITGVIRFSSDLSGKLILLEYISDGLATDGQMKVHKFAEEAIYKYVAHAILNTRSNVPEYQIARFKKELKAAKHNAKIRLSNLKIQELAQVLRNQSKWIKH
tara:strand:- start:418 stop:1329 length:912 start_codon:yes stop_codon:yes gene_type:complete